MSRLPEGYDGRMPRPQPKRQDAYIEREVAKARNADTKTVKDIALLIRGANQLWGIPLVEVAPEDYPDLKADIRRAQLERSFHFQDDTV